MRRKTIADLCLLRRRAAMQCEAEAACEPRADSKREADRLARTNKRADALHVIEAKSLRVYKCQISQFQGFSKWRRFHGSMHESKRKQFAVLKGDKVFL